MAEWSGWFKNLLLLRHPCNLIWDHLSLQNQGGMPRVVLWVAQNAVLCVMWGSGFALGFVWVVFNLNDSTELSVGLELFLDGSRGWQRALRAGWPQQHQ